LLTAKYFGVLLDTQQDKKCSTTSSSSVEHKKQEKGEIHDSTSAPTVVASKDADIDTNSADNDEVSSISPNSSRLYSVGGSNVNNAAELSSQQSTAFSYLSSYLQLINNVNKVTSNHGNSEDNTTKDLLMTMFSWIKDLSKELQLRILSSFSMQQMFASLEITSDKVIISQLTSHRFEEIFAADYKNYYAQDDFTDSAAKYARMAQSNTILLGDSLAQQDIDVRTTFLDT
jgi:hypothetical protein